MNIKRVFEALKSIPNDCSKIKGEPQKEQNMRIAAIAMKIIASFCAVLMLTLTIAAFVATPVGALSGVALVLYNIAYVVFCHDSIVIFDNVLKKLDCPVQFIAGSAYHLFRNSFLEEAIGSSAQRVELNYMVRDTLLIRNIFKLLHV